MFESAIYINISHLIFSGSNHLLARALSTAKELLRDHPPVYKAPCPSHDFSYPERADVFMEGSEVSLLLLPCGTSENYEIALGA